MPNLSPGDARTYNPVPTPWKYDPQTNILWLKLTDIKQHHLVPYPPQPVPAVSRLHRQPDLSIDSRAWLPGHTHRTSPARLPLNHQCGQKLTDIEADTGADLGGGNPQ